MGETMQRKPRVLFLSTGNSTRGQMAEGFLRTLAADRFIVSSAGIRPGGLDPLAKEVMKEIGIDITGQKSKSVAQALKEHYGYVITVCDMAKERSPIFPFTFNLLHWSIEDPSTSRGSPAETREAFRRVRDDIKIKVQYFLGESVENEREQGVLAYA
jgi:arsenate reductase